MMDGSDAVTVLLRSSEEIPEFLLYGNKDHDQLVDVSLGMAVAVPGFAQLQDYSNTQNFFLVALEAVYYMGYRMGKRNIPTFVLPEEDVDQ